MAAIRDNEQHETTPSVYAVVDGRKIPLTPAQRCAWNEMINRNRRYARNFGTCGQPDYRKCLGDCGSCPYQTEGSFVYADDRERYADGFSSGRFAPAAPEPTPEDETVKASVWEWLYGEADKTVRRGKDILFLYLEEGLSAHQISARTGIAKSTVVDRLNRLLAFIREHREDLV